MGGCLCVCVCAQQAWLCMHAWLCVCVSYINNERACQLEAQVDIQNYSTAKYVFDYYFLLNMHSSIFVNKAYITDQGTGLLFYPYSCFSSFFAVAL